ncbi:phage late control D family protein [Ruegeria sp. MALMAid1280]|uniref:phage late control D family protein n=1 Tax=Ruegeria sp. MALMAid1280 TaxID=3411634 RepID=UPI003BA36664
MLILLDRETHYGDFYVPAFSVRMGGRDLVRDRFLTIPSVEVDLKLKAAGRFSFSVANAFDLTKREFVAGEDGAEVDLLELFRLGAEVEIRMGYGEPARLPLIMLGLVTELGSSFSNGVPELRIAGFDKLYKLGKSNQPRHWEDSRDSDVVSDLANRQGIRADAERTDPEKTRIEKGQETDLKFIEKLAKRNSATFYMRGDRMKFGPRNNDLDQVLTMEWGKGLLSFDPEANLAEQVSRVELVGWSPQNAQPIVGLSDRGDQSGQESGRRGGGDHVAEALGETTLYIRQPVHSQAEADTRARAVREERAEKFITASGECIGLPEVLPDTNLGLGGLGRLFSRVYYVEQATHAIGADGYKTRFKVQETTL